MQHNAVQNQSINKQVTKQHHTIDTTLSCEITGLSLNNRSLAKFGFQSNLLEDYVTRDWK